MADYWKDREVAARQALLNKSRKEIDKKLKKYYINISKRLIKDYESLYDQVLLKQANGEQISPATLYQLDKYWELQAQTRKLLNKFGAYQQSLLSKVFEVFYQQSYKSLNVKGLTAFRTLDESAVRQVLESVWTTDGKSWSQRIWNNTALLQQTLEEGLVECVATGKKTTQLKEILQERFNVSYGRADTLVRTEMAHIQTEAAKQRYKDYGIQQVEIWADEDERRCPDCGKLHQKKYPVGAHVPIPLHPRCRCCIVPVVDVDV
jgi:SPP1 gp7 family putative phage head morphogenesis protein